jgi:hypothetical protein
MLFPSGVSIWCFRLVFSSGDRTAREKVVVREQSTGNREQGTGNREEWGIAEVG